MDVKKIISELRCVTKLTNDRLLFEAIFQKKMDIVRLLLKNDKSIVNCVGFDKMTPLGYASSKSELDLCLVLLECGGEVNGVDGNGWTPLHHAASEGHTNIVQLLLDHGAEPNCLTSPRKFTPLHLATLNNKIHMIHCLKSYEVWINKRDFKGRTVLHMAIEESLDNEYFRLFIHMGVNVNLKNKLKDTPLIHAIKFNNVEAIQELIKGGADVNKRDKRKMTPLYIATEYGHYETMEALIKHGEGIISKCLDDVLHLCPTALHLAIFKEYNETILSLLISTKEGLEERNSNGQTPLMLATRLNNPTAAYLLVVAGADRLAEDFRRNDPVRIAGMSKNWTLMAALFGINKVFKDEDDILQIAIERNIAFAEALVEYGQIITHGHAMRIILKQFYQPSIDFLCNADNARFQLKKNCYCLRSVIERKEPRLIRKLLELGANPNRDCSLHGAIESEDIEAINTLIEFNVDINKLVCKKTPLSVAIELEKFEVVELLLQAKCDPNLIPTCKCKKSPLQMAIEIENLDLVNLLLNYGAKPTQRKDELLSSILTNQISTVKMLVEKKAKIKPYHIKIASLCGNDEIVSFLLAKHCVNFSPVFSFETESSDDIYLVYNNRKIILKYLKDLDKKGNSPLKLTFINKKHMCNRLGCYGPRTRQEDEIFEFIDMHQLTIVKMHVLDVTTAIKVYGKGDDVRRHYYSTIFLVKNVGVNDIKLCINFMKYKRLEENAMLKYIQNVKERDDMDDNLNNFDVDGYTLLHAAAVKGYHRIVEILINENVDINIACDNTCRCTPLFLAEKNHSSEIARILIESGADLDINNSSMQTVLSTSIRHGYFDISHMLIAAGASTQYGIDKSCLNLAIEYGDIELIKTLKEIQEHQPLSPIPLKKLLKYVAYNRDVDNKKEILELFRDDLFRVDAHNNNAAFIATRNLGSPKMLKAILEINPNLGNSQNMKSGIILHSIVMLKEEEFNEFFECLEAFGVDLDLMCEDEQETALYKAIRLDRKEIATTLVKSKANCSLGSLKMKQSSIELAIDKKFEDLVELMISAGTKAPKNWPRRPITLKNLARISIRNTIPQKFFRKNIEMYSDYKLLRNMLLYED